MGETIGVAPEADLYFVGIGGIWAGEPVGNWFVAARRAMHTGQTVALAIERVLEMNRHLEPDRKIRAIAIAVGRVARWLDDKEPAIAEARAQEIFVSSIDLNPRPLGRWLLQTQLQPTPIVGYRLRLVGQSHIGQEDTRWRIKRTPRLRPRSLKKQFRTRGRRSISRLT